MLTRTIYPSYPKQGYRYRDSLKTKLGIILMWSQLEQEEGAVTTYMSHIFVVFPVRLNFEIS